MSDTNIVITKTQDGIPVIDSLTIAEGCNVQHKNVMELVRKYQNDFNVFGGVAFETRSFETAGGAQNREIALLNEDQATLLFTYLKNTEVARTLKVRVVKAFRDCRDELAKVKANPFADKIPKTYPDALRLAADLVDKNEKLTAEKKVLEETAAKNAPKVAFTDSVLASSADVNVTAAAKTLGIGPRKFFDWLRLSGFLYKQTNQAMQSAIDAGYMVVRFAKVNHSDFTEDKPYAHITGKGLYYFYQRLRKDGLIAANEKLELTA